MNVNMFLNIFLLKLHNGLPSDRSCLNVHVQGFRDMTIFSDRNETKSYLRILSNIAGRLKQSDFAGLVQ